ncbi:hypothetical protein HO133_003403 [Letharia lupina]|uniref:Uncharacterized protein n=1 Tax=Letharia lupina TaxID=560253 RepID=A0A8H6CBP0_9LECA|nr:uncharacterized protein HO133_003403 [Letharia lupina]KAF6220271.1 hypothetical protein HO133_003403 [Letharia lupina]
MPIPHPSFLYRESTEPPTVALPLEARKIHFCHSALLGVNPYSSSHLYKRVGPWTILNPSGVGTYIPTGYAFRHDMVHGGRCARTVAENEVKCYVRTLVCKGGKLEGWWPRTENYRGDGHCFDCIFLRPNNFGCTIDAEPAADTPEPGTPSPEEPQPDIQIVGTWDPLPEPATAGSEADPRGSEAPETALAREESVEYDESQAGDTSSDDESDDVSPTAHVEREARRQREARMETRRMMLVEQMRRVHEA